MAWAPPSAADQLSKLQSIIEEHRDEAQPVDQLECRLIFDDADRRPRFAASLISSLPSASLQHLLACFFPEFSWTFCCDFESKRSSFAAMVADFLVKRKLLLVESVDATASGILAQLQQAAVATAARLDKMDKASAVRLDAMQKAAVATAARLDEMDKASAVRLDAMHANFVHFSSVIQDVQKDVHHIRDDLSKPLASSVRQTTQYWTSEMSKAASNPQSDLFNERFAVVDERSLLDFWDAFLLKLHESLGTVLTIRPSNKPPFSLSLEELLASRNSISLFLSEAHCQAFCAWAFDAVCSIISPAFVIRDTSAKGYPTGPEYKFDFSMFPLDSLSESEDNVAWIDLISFGELKFNLDLSKLCDDAHIQFINGALELLDKQNHSAAPRQSVVAFLSDSRSIRFCAKSRADAPSVSPRWLLFCDLNIGAPITDGFRALVRFLTTPASQFGFTSSPSFANSSLIPSGAIVKLIRGHSRKPDIYHVKQNVRLLCNCFCSLHK